MSKNASQHKEFVDESCSLLIIRQCKLLEVNRSNFYYKSVGESSLNLEFVNLIGEEYLLHPWLGVPRMTTRLIKDKGYSINKKRVERLYRLLSISALGQKPNTSKKGKVLYTRCSNMCLKLPKLSEAIRYGL